MKPKEVKALFKNFKEDETEVQNINSLWDSFLTKFTPDFIQNSMDEYDYAIGTNEDSYSYYLEWKLHKTGSIRGGSSAKFGFYYGKYGEDEEKKYRATKSFSIAGNPSIALIKEELYSLIMKARSLGELEDIKSKFSNMVKFKTIFLYNPKILIPIYSEEHLDHLIDLLEIETSADNYVDKNKAILNYKNIHFPRCDNRKFMAFIYEKIWPYLFEDDIYDFNEKSQNYDENVSLEYSNARKPSTKVEINKVNAYVRNTEEASKAYKISGGHCEFCHEHSTFIARRTGKPYLETHHLIPMKEQSDFIDISIDVAQNMVCLCSNCHNQLHYGRDWETILRKIYELRKDVLDEYGIHISYDKIRRMYRLHGDRRS